MKTNLQVILLFFILLTAAKPAFALKGVPALLPFQGRLTDPSGNPINYPVSVQFRIYPPSGTCFLYEETQSITPNLYGVFSTIIGTGTTSGPTNTLFQAFDNDIANPIPNSCAATYTPSMADWRRLEIIVEGTALADMQTIGTSAYAIAAQSLGGKTADDFILRSTNVTQANVEALVDGSDASALHTHDSLYAKINSSNSFGGDLSTSGNIVTTGAASTIGIGVSSPVADLHIKKDDPVIRLEGNSGANGSPRLDFYGGTNLRGRIETSETTNGLKIYSGSNLGIELDASANAIFSGSIRVAGTVGLGRYNSSQESALLGYLTSVGSLGTGSMWVSTASNQVKYWNGSSAIVLGSSLGYTPVNIAGDTMTGALVLNADPTANLGAATKQYIDAAIATSGGSFIRKDGTVAFTASQSMGSNRLTSVADPSAAQDAATKNYVDTKLLTKTLPSAPAAGQDGQVLRWNNGSSAWEFFSPSVGTVTSVSVTSPITNSGTATAPNINLADTAVTAGSYGSASSVAAFTVDAKGRLTAASNTSIAIAPTALTQGGATSNQVLKWNGTNWAPAADSGLTSINSSDVTTALGFTPPTTTYVDANLFGEAGTAPTAGQNGQSIRWNNTAGNWEYYSPAVGSVTSVGVTAPITNTGTATAPVLALSYSPLNKAGDTMSGALAMGTNKVTGVGDPSAAQDAATKNYVDTKLLTKTLPSAPAAGQDGQVLRWNNGSSAWEFFSPSAGTVTSVSVTSPITNSGTATAPNINLADTAVTAGSYGSASSVAAFTVDAKGRLTSASNTSIAIAPTAITQGGATSNQVLKWNGTNWAAATDSGLTSINSSDVTTALGFTPLNKAGDTMSGVLAMGTNKITGVGDPSSAQDAATKNYVDTKFITKTLPSAPTSGQDGQSIRWNNGSSLWEYFTPSAATLTSLSVTSPITNTGTATAPNINLADTAVSAGSYGSASSVVAFTVDAKGRLTSASNTSIAIAPTAITQGGATSNQVLKWNGTNWAPAADSGLTSINSSDVTTALGFTPPTTTYVDANLFGETGTAPTAGQNGQSIRWNNAAGNWEYYTPNAGAVTSVGVTAPITNTGTATAPVLALSYSPLNKAGDTMSGALAMGTNKISGVGDPSSAQDVATKNYADTKLLTKTLPTAPAAGQDGQVLRWNNGSSAWEFFSPSAGTVTSVSVTSPITNSGTATAPNINLADTAVTAGSYGSASSVAALTVDAKGRLTAASNTSIALAPTAITQGGATSNQVLKWNGTNWAPAADAGLTSISSSDVTTALGFTPVNKAGDTMSGALAMGTNKITGVGDPSSAQDVSTKNYADTKFITKTLPSAPTSGQNGQSIRWNNGSSIWEYFTPSAATLTSLSVTSPITNTGTATAPNINLADTAVTAGSYGSASSVPTYTVDAKGRLTAASNTSIAIAPTAITQGGATSNQVLKWNGSNWAAAADAGLTSIGSSDVTTALGFSPLNKAGDTMSGALAMGTNKVTGMGDPSAAQDAATKNYVDTKLLTKTLPSAPAAGQDGQVLRWNNGSSAWEFFSPSTGTVSSVSVTSPITNSGTATAPNINLADTTVTAASYGSASAVATFTVDAKGRLTAASNTSIALAPTAITQGGATSNQVLKWNGTNWAPAADAGLTSISSSNVTTALGFTPLNKAGDTMSGALAMGTNKITGAGDPTAAQDVATKNYADTKFITKTLPSAPTSGQDGQSIRWNNGSSVWEYFTPSAATLTSLSVTSPITNTGTATAPNINLADTAVTAASYGSASSVATFTVDAKGRLTAASNTAIAVAPTAITQGGATSNQVLKWNGTNWAAAADSGLTSINSSNVTTALGFTPLNKAGDTMSGAIAMGTNKITGMGDPSAAQDATTKAYVDAKLLGQTLPSTPGSGQNGQSLRWNNGSSAWEFFTAGSGSGTINSISVTSPVTNTGTSTDPVIALAYTPVNKAGDTMSGAIAMGTNKITGMGDPSSAQDAATKNYVDTKLLTKTLPSAPAAGQDGQALRWNNGSSAWEFFSPSAGTVTSVSVTSPITNSGTATAPNFGLADTAVTASSYGSASSVATFTVDAKGRLTNAGSTAIAIAPTALTQGGATSNQVLKWNGTNWAAAADSGLTSISSSDVTTALGFTPLNKAGDTMSGALAMGTNKVTGMGDPSAAQDAATKNYVDTKLLTKTLPSAPAAGQDGQALRWNNGSSAWEFFSPSAGTVTSVSVTSPVTNTGTATAPNFGLADTAVTASSYGSASSVATFTVDAKGRLTNAGNTAIAIAPTALTQGGATSNQVLKWNGTNWAAATDSGSVTSVATGTGLTGGTITSTGTISLATIANNTVLANTSGSTAAPSATTPTSILDSFSSTQGSILYRNASAWVALSPGTSGQVLQSGGASANPSWAAAADSTKVAKTGDTMTGTLNLASNGLVVGTTQLVASGGFIGIGTATPAQTLDVNGTVRATNLLLTSDQRMKTDIKSLDTESSLEKICRLNPVAFKWKKDGKPELGFIAQELQKVFSDLVIKNDDETLAIKYTALISPIVSSVQELNKINQKLKQENQQLRDRFNKLDQESSEMKSELKEIKALLKKLTSGK